MLLLKSFQNKLFILFSCLLINQNLLSIWPKISNANEGFVAGTLVKTENKYVPIEQFKVNDCVVSYDFNNAKISNNKILDIKKNKVKKVFKITVNGQDFQVAENHKFYCPLSKNRWVEAKDLKPFQLILKNITEIVRIEKIIEINKEADVYTLSVENNHNFFISNQDILVHNFAVTIPVFEFVVGAGFKWATGKTLTAGLSALVLGYIFEKNGGDTSNFNPTIHFNDSALNTNNNNNNFQNGGSFDPNDPKIPDEIKKILEKIAWGYITNSAAKKVAKYLGYKLEKNPPFNSHGQLTFKRGNTFISPDIDNHNGGFWKVFQKGVKDRQGTYNWNLTKMTGK